MRQVLTISEIRRILFETENTVEVNSVEMTNKQARDFFYNFDNQDKLLKVLTDDNVMWIMLKD